MLLKKDLSGKDMDFKKKKIKKPKFQSFQDTIINLQKYWSKQGCVILQQESCQEGGPPRFKRDAVAGDRLKSKLQG